MNQQLHAWHYIIYVFKEYVQVGEFSSGQKKKNISSVYEIFYNTSVSRSLIFIEAK